MKSPTLELSRKLNALLTDSQPLYSLIARLRGQVPHFHLLDQRLIPGEEEEVLRRLTCYRLGGEVASLHLALLLPRRMDPRAWRHLWASASLAEVMSGEGWQKSDLRCAYHRVPPAGLPRPGVLAHGLFPGWVRVFRVTAGPLFLGRVWEFLPSRWGWAPDG